jgi:hypothetical protein
VKEFFVPLVFSVSFHKSGEMKERMMCNSFQIARVKVFIFSKIKNILGFHGA